MLENTTTIVLVVVTVGLIVYDIAIASLKSFLGVRGQAVTLTQVIKKYSVKYPIIPFFFGFLFGHFYGDF